ncbi:MAG: sugar phosphate isomerase/epimerase family protein, partial [Terriglobales bacterium]
MNQAAEDPPRTSMGVAQYSFPGSPYIRSSYGFLEYCHSLGAGGVQVEIDSLDPNYLAKLRRRTTELRMYLEVIVELPQRDAADFERHVIAARQAGADCLRAHCLLGRRYENFTSLDQWKTFVAESDRRLALAVPVLEKHQLALGLENHKDWTAEEMLDLLARHSSEYLGVCLDTGNNLALLDDPAETIRKLAPHAVTTHFKDVAAKEYPEGFLLSEVPLGRGILDLAWAVECIRQARPRARLNLEMITRDPLRIPCLTDQYWVTFPERSRDDLARTLALVRTHPPAE